MGLRTSLYPIYANYPNIKIVNFNGWDMPVNYAFGILKEHKMVRERAGLFDASHMGEFLIEGEGTELFVDYLLTNSIAGKPNNKCIYSPMCNHEGGIIDDLLVYKYSANKVMLVVNAGNIKNDFTWISERKKEFSNSNKINIKNISSQTALLALQGPLSEKILSKYFNQTQLELRPFSYAGIEFPGIGNCVVSRTGYTGEDGFEIFLSNSQAPKFWESLLKDNRIEDLAPCGLGARNTLRLEAALSLYGAELDNKTTPLESGLARYVKMDKSDFIGKKAISSNPVKKELKACVMLDRGAPKHGDLILYKEKEIGIVTSGSISPTLNEFIALIIVEKCGLKPGDQIIINTGAKMKNARIVEKPFYRRR